jgi:tRNA (guanine26-N2/guanine27-N2)-dimethyltransferase
MEVGAAMRTIIEGSARIKVSDEKKISRKLEVFYNPVMKLNRDITVLLLNSVPDTQMQIAVPMAGTGIRGIRFFKELAKGKVKSISINDHSERAFKGMKENLKLNKIGKKVLVSCSDANLFLLNSSGFDYIDIDPFGTPNPFLDSAVNRIAREGIIGVTATDTSALAGSYPNVCIRKYWAVPLRNELMHEIGVRILIRKVQLIGAQYGKALTPIFSYSKDHYYRVFFRSNKSKSMADKILTKHAHFQDAGPLWIGSLWDVNLVKNMVKNAKEHETLQFLKIIYDEAKVDTFGFFDLHAIAAHLKLKTIPAKEAVLEAVRKKGYKAVNTHFTGTGVRTDMSIDEFLEIFK